MRKRRILIVDNNDDLRAILEDALGLLGHEAVVTGDRDEALNRDDLDQFDLIISDLTEDAQTVDQSDGPPCRSRQEQKTHIIRPVAMWSTDRLTKRLRARKTTPRK